MPALRSLLSLIATLCVLLPLVGCGYRNLMAAPSSQGGEPGGAQGAEAVSIAVLALHNGSQEPGLDRVVLDALTRELSLRGTFQLERDPRRADFVLRGRVKPLGLRGNSFSAFLVAIEYQVTLALELELLRAEGDVIRLADAELSESDIYLASQDVEITRTNRLEALRHVSDLLATRVADRVEWITEPRRQGTDPEPAPGADDS